MAEHESDKERIDRELTELVSELRLTLPGVQMLFAFLFVVPFNDRFDKLSDEQRSLYLAVFLTAAVATALLIAPASYHRICFRHGDKEAILFTATRMSIAGTAALSVSLTGAILLIGSMLLSSVGAAIVVTIAGALFSGLWFVLPIAHRAKALRRRGHV